MTTEAWRQRAEGRELCDCGDFDEDHGDACADADVPVYALPGVATPHLLDMNGKVLCWKLRAHRLHTEGVPIDGNRMCQRCKEAGAGMNILASICHRLYRG